MFFGKGRLCIFFVRGLCGLREVLRWKWGGGSEELEVIVVMEFVEDWLVELLCL